jgi:hypothetical protein
MISSVNSYNCSINRVRVSGVSFEGAAIFRWSLPRETAAHGASDGSEPGIGEPKGTVAVFAVVPFNLSKPRPWVKSLARLS